ncbi:MAG TPA: hypothetical protein VG847_05310, partial [Chitinophagaceae bacterium]|nr:hypothetical protein [Chitinophagaceae bacterium]
MLRRILTFILIFICTTSNAQVFGGDPPSLKWEQINTPLARIIFPKGLDSIGERIANIVTYINNPMLTTIGSQTGKINLVAQNQTTISNAYVALGPFRSEFLLTPLQNSFDLGSLPWPDQLTIHEYRHVQQDNNFNVGLSRVMHTIFGENGQALANNASIPNWFYEGDAVYNETNVSRQGRGNLPFFLNGFRALWKDGRNYSWMKLRNGSYKDFVPDHYPLGFMMVAYGRQQFGDSFWENVTHDAASFKGLLYPFQHALKKYSGEDYVPFRNDALNFFKGQFNLENIQQSKNKKHLLYEDEEFPVFIGKDAVLFVKSSLRQIPQFTIRIHNRDIKLKTRDFSLDGQFSYRNRRIVYAAYTPDVRWGYRDYSDLRIINTTNGNEYTLTSHSKYFSPDINEDGTRVVAAYVPPDSKYQLHLLDATTGKIIKIVPNPEHLFYTYPKFYKNNLIISPVRNSKGEMSLAIINISDGSSDYLLPFSYNVIGFPYVYNDTVYFSCSYKKNDELFAFTMADRKVWLLQYPIHKGVGRYEPAADDKNILWVEFTSYGYKLQQAAKSDIQFIETEPGLADTAQAFGISVLHKTNYDLLATVPHDSFAVSKYNKGYRLFNFHSIEPQTNDPDYTLNLISENVLNTLVSQLSFTYNRAEKSKQIGFNGTYGAWFPMVSAGINYTFDRKTFYHNNTVRFDEWEPYAGFNIPLNLSKNRTFTFIDFGSQYVYNQSEFKGLYKDSLGNISYSYSSNFFTFSHQTQTTVQRYYPEFAQTLNTTYKTPLGKYHGYQFLADARLYLPGFASTHTIILDGALLAQDTLGQLNFSSEFPFSRGYSAINLYRMYKWGIDYHFPLLYPDAGFGEMFYLLRARGDIFYDYTETSDFYTDRTKFSAKFRSA